MSHNVSNHTDGKSSSTASHISSKDTRDLLMTREGRGRILVCDDEELIRWSIAEHLKAEGYIVETAEDGQDCLDKVALATPDAIIMDIKMPRLDGLSALRRLRQSENDLPVVMITAHGAIDSAIEATKLGASAYLAKPFDLREISLQLHKVFEQHRLTREVSYLRDKNYQRYEKLVGESPAMQNVFDMLRRLENIDAPTVLITGESGTGKDLVAQAIHARGPRKNMPFMEIDCASLPDQLIEAELFGYEKGAFTDARQTKRGLFEVAKGGVIFLDEIGELSLGTQAKLLRALENRRFKRVGGVVDIPLDAAIIAATNRNLRNEVQQGRFREDLFFRLNVVPLEIPSLRKRLEDVPLLATHLLTRLNRDLGRNVAGFTADALRAMEGYGWPGNIRELRNIVERIVILKGDESPIRLDDMPAEIRFCGKGESSLKGCPFTLPNEGVNLEAVEAGLLQQALQRTNFNQSAAARLLGITRYALRYRMEKHGMATSKSHGDHSHSEEGAVVDHNGHAGKTSEGNAIDDENTAH